MQTSNHDIIKTLIDLFGQVPIDEEILISDTMPWSINYHNRKHVFMWNPSSSAIILNLKEYGQGTIPSQQWFNLGLKPNSPIFTSGQATPIPFIVRYTDEVIP